MASQAGSFYELLQVAPDAPFDSIRRNFHAAALALHPDRQKLAQHSQSVSKKQIVNITDSYVVDSKDCPLPEQFHQIQLAWETLRDPVSREIYDEQLRIATDLAKAQAPVAINEEIALEEMDVAELEGVSGQRATVYSHPCRCGDCYSVDREELLSATHNTFTPDLRPGQNDDTALSRTSRGLHSIVVQCGSCSLYIRIQFSQVELRDQG
jgi:curved DNA-binding protein CbpA